MIARIVGWEARTGTHPKGIQFAPELAGEQQVSPVRAIPHSTLRRTPLVTPSADGGSPGRTHVSTVSADVGFRRLQASG